MDMGVVSIPGIHTTKRCLAVNEMASDNIISSPYLLKRFFYFVVASVPFLLLVYKKNFIPVTVNALLKDSSGISAATFNLNSSHELFTGRLLQVNKGAKPLVNVKKTAEVIKASWTSVGGKGEKDSFHLFSAYYDNRSTSLRPTVIVFGYFWNEVKKRPLYCLFTYEDGRTDCMKKPLEIRGIASCMAPNLGGLPYFFYCPAEQHSSPVSVMVSEASDCNRQFTSKEVAVGNRDQNKKPSKKFGICVGGPVIGHNNTLQDLIEFVSINKILGAELISIYVIPNQVSKEITDEVLRRYPDVVRLIEWRDLKKWSPIHYYGQYLLIQDCLYRSMYEVEYLFHQDLDEVFIPVGGKNWTEVIPKIPGIEKGAAFKHQNHFFSVETTDPGASFPTEDCGGLKVPKYLRRTKWHPCFAGWNYRSKPMTKPRFTLEVAIHDVCVVLPGYTNPVLVPTEVAFLGHFRGEIPKDCLGLKQPVITDLWASKYSSRLHEIMCRNGSRT